jgi:hypothetical protein
VTLTPKRPPGRLNRKALAFAPDIQRLHWQGHSCEAIRQALAEAGLTVSRSTVTREVARQAKRRQPDQTISGGLAPPAERPSPPEQTSAALSTLASDPRSGREIAKAWVADRNPNPLFRARIANESSRH